MYNSFQLAKKYLHYYLSASNMQGHGMHSPFVFDFILNVLNNKSNYVPPIEIEELRKELLRDGRMIHIEDLGAGSRKASSAQKQVSQIAASALKPKKYAQLLYRFGKHYQPQTIVELGTSLGITTAYFSKACPEAKLITIEGSPEIFSLAKENLTKLGRSHVKQLQGNFDDVLTNLLQVHPSIDLAYIDGNHRYEPTMRYFHQFLSHSHSHSVLIFDDIHWSKEMEKAWEEIKQHPSVQYSIDVFFLGFVFFRNEFKIKQHFSIRF